MVRHTEFYPDPVGAKKGWTTDLTQLTVRTSFEFVNKSEAEALFSVRSRKQVLLLTSSKLNLSVMEMGLRG